MLVQLKSDHGINHILWSRLCSPPAFIWAWETGKRQVFILLGALVTRTVLAVPAMMKPSLCILPSALMRQHCLHCVVAQLVRLFSHPWLFHILFCTFHMLLYSKHRMQLTIYSDWQFVWLCLLCQHPPPPPPSILFSFNVICCLQQFHSNRLLSSAQCAHFTDETSQTNIIANNRWYWRDLEINSSPKVEQPCFEIHNDMLSKG